MPTRRSRLTKKEENEYRAGLVQLESLGILNVFAEDLCPRLERFNLKQVDADFSRIFELPAGEVAVVLSAKLTILKSGVMFTDAMLFPEWDEWPLDLEGAREHRYFDRLKYEGSSDQPKILNDLLVGQTRPLQVGQDKGLIIATGWTSIPEHYPDEKSVPVTLLLKDEQGVEFSWDFAARVNRVFKRQYERSRPDPQEVAQRLRQRVPLFEAANAEPAVNGDASGDAKIDNVSNLELPIDNHIV